MPFTEDLKFGEVYQSILLNYIHEDYEEVEFAPQNQAFKDWDVKVSKGNYICRYEVKADRLTNKTGNVCIEYECNGRPSGIATTQADVYAYFVVKNANDFDCYLIPVKFIKTLIESGDYRKMVGGDRYRSKFFLIPLNRFSSFLTGKK